MMWRVLTFFALLMSTAALVIAIMAYQRAGGDFNLQQMMQETRQESANALERLEEFVRGDRDYSAGIKNLRER
ncbi:MAG: hypothetical protein ACE5K9_00010 [Candidatus Methylomirabilales bacterium]